MLSLINYFDLSQRLFLFSRSHAPAWERIPKLITYAKHCQPHPASPCEGEGLSFRVVVSSLLLPVGEGWGEGECLDLHTSQITL